jgi:hypothetical protein
LLKPYANGFLTQITLKNAQNKHTVPKTLLKLCLYQSLG